MDQNTLNQSAPQFTTGPRHKKRLGMLFSIFVIVLLAGAGYGAYAWQHTKVTTLDAKVQSLNSRAVTLNKQLAAALANKPINEAPATTLTTDEQVLAAAEAFCEAAVDPATQKPLLFTGGTAKNKKVLYSSEKNFAYVNAVCSSDGTTEGSGAAYYLKKVNNLWVVLYRGQMSDDTKTKEYAIPSEFN